MILGILKWLCKLGWYSFPVEVLHKAYLLGRIGQDELYDLLRPKQLNNFINHHETVKASFAKSEELGLTKTDELADGVQKLINDPIMQEILKMHGEVTTTSEERRRIIAAFNQLDGRIKHKVLEREVLTRHGKQNVVMDQADHD